MVAALLSILYWSYFFIGAAVWATFLLVVRLFTKPFDRDGRLIHSMTCAFAYHCVAINPLWRVKFENKQLLKEHDTLLITANHQSMADILVLSGLGIFYKWVAKAQALQLLGVGALMRVNGYATVAHGEIKSVRRMLKQTRQWLERGISVFIFPEGERTFDGSLLEFKEGPFKLACQTGSPVVPLALDGTHQILPRGRWVLNFRGDIIVRCLEPVHPSEADYSPDRLREVVKARIESALMEIRQRSQCDQWYSTTPLADCVAAPCVVPEER